MDTLTERARRLESEGVFLGGPANLFAEAGPRILIALLSEGLTPDAHVLDIGCGCLRGGYWLIHFLSKEHYFGIEPNIDMVDAGRRILLEPGLEEEKRPRFDHNSDFEFGVFGVKFDYLVARSIWTHASKLQILRMLDGFVDHCNPSAVLLASYMRPTISSRDYKGDGWVGRSHESNAPGIVRHSFGWIRSECAKRELSAAEIKNDIFDFGGQTWIRIERAESIDPDRR